MTTNLPPEAVEAAARAEAETVAARVYPEPYHAHMRQAYADAYERGYLAALPLLTVKPDRDTIAQAVYTAVVGTNYKPWKGHSEDRWNNALEAADAVLAVLPGRTEAQVKAEALIEFADATRFPPEWVLFRRDDGSGVTVGQLLRETAARLRGEV